MAALRKEDDTEKHLEDDVLENERRPTKELPF
jgi:hypothetical protein